MLHGTPDFWHTAKRGVMDVHLATTRKFPCFALTLKALRSCPISTLTFSKISVGEEMWGIVLPHLAHAAWNLTSVSFIDVQNLPETYIVQFLARLPRVVELEIRTTVLHPWDLRTTTGCPSSRTLCASAQRPISSGNSSGVPGP
ncbi:hypothetical protein B0H13DRAFT_1878183 [Mycena leptocephala]|nr:hypothetical protein B0H13DRAFT_1878183 [Mycena leptocephala]